MKSDSMESFLFRILKLVKKRNFTGYTKNCLKESEKTFIYATWMFHFKCKIVSY
jgi:hypothetical protein